VQAEERLCEPSLESTCAVAEAECPSGRKSGWHMLQYLSKGEKMLQYCPKEKKYQTPALKNQSYRRETRHKPHIFYHNVKESLWFNNHPPRCSSSNIPNRSHFKKEIIAMNPMEYLRPELRHKNG
jgi:hypothetical protein